MIKECEMLKRFEDSKIILFPSFKKQLRGDDIKGLKLAWLACMKGLRR
jgi:hypothetical protein